MPQPLGTMTYGYRITFGVGTLVSGFRYETAKEAEQAAEARIAMEWPNNKGATYEIEGR